MPRKYNKYHKDHFPNLRRRSGLSDEDEGVGPASRRARLISKALLRARRRWDSYAVTVIAGQLDGKQSAETQEWKLILQNGRLLKSIRKLSIFTPERNSVDAENSDRKIPMYEMRLREGGSRRERYPGE